MGKYRKRKIGKSDLKLYLSITVFCFLLAIGLNFFLKCGSDITDDIRMITDTELDTETVIKLKKAYEEDTGMQVRNPGDISPDDLKEQDIEKLKNELKKKLDPSQIERYKEKFKRYQEQNRD